MNKIQPNASPEAIREATGHPLCRFCGAPLTRTFVHLGMSPLANSYLRPDQLDQMEPFFPLHVYVCEECFLVQLQEFEIPANIFGGDYAYFSSFSESWLQHAREYTEEVVERFGLGPHTRVVEIASNDGYLLQYFQQKKIPVLGVEPAANVAQVARNKGIPTISKFFGVDTARELVAAGSQGDLINATNVLPHVPDVNDFVAGIKILLKPRGIVTLQFQYLVPLVLNNEFDTIYHEHYSYLSYFTVENILASHGLSVFDVEQFPTHGGSIRIYAQHLDTGVHPVSPTVQALRNEELRAGVNTLRFYEGFLERVEETKRSLLEFLIKLKRQGRHIAGYGAPAKGNTLLNYCGIRTDFIDYTVDLNPAKQGHLLPGTHIPIYAPDKLSETQPDYVLILPWNLQDEIVAQTSYIRSWGGKHVIPIPSVKVL